MLITYSPCLYWFTEWAGVDPLQLKIVEAIVTLEKGYGVYVGFYISNPSVDHILNIY